MANFRDQESPEIDRKLELPKRHLYLGHLLAISKHRCVFLYPINSQRLDVNPATHSSGRNLCFEKDLAQ